MSAASSSSRPPDRVAATSSPWDYEDVYDGPWYVFREPRDEHRLAIKSGHYTILTVGDYFDGGGPIEERLTFVCSVVNASLDALGSRCRCVWDANLRCPIHGEPGRRSSAATTRAPSEGRMSKAACTCAEHEACSDPNCRGPYYTEVEFWTRTAVPSDAELRKVVVRAATPSEDTE